MTGATPTIGRMKAQAKDLRRSGACTHAQALEAIARNAGFGSYAHARKVLLQETQS